MKAEFAGISEAGRPAGYRICKDFDRGATVCGNVLRADRDAYAARDIGVIYLGVVALRKWFLPILAALWLAGFFLIPSDNVFHYGCTRC